MLDIYAIIPYIDPSKSNILQISKMGGAGSEPG